MASCPISNQRIDTNLVRVISFQIFFFTLLFAVTQNMLFMGIILFDLTVRVLRKDSFSLFAQTGKFILEQWNAVPRYTDESPKRFALYLGLSMTVTITALAFFGLFKTAVAVALILMICAFIEVLFDFCIGCKIYYTLQLFKAIKDDRNFN